MSLKLVRNDITKIKCDAIVNAANRTLLGGGGVERAIHRAAGPSLLLECMRLGGCRVGAAKITKGGKLPCRYVIHTVGPRWQGGNDNECELLASCYRQSLRLALENQCESIAFPLISSGFYGFPKDRALRIAVDTVSDFLRENEMTVYVAVYDSASNELGRALYPEIEQYIDDNYVKARVGAARAFSIGTNKTCCRAAPLELEEKSLLLPDCSCAKSLEEVLCELDESFSQMLLRKIDEKGMTDAECYKRANVDRKHFSKIRSNPAYKPSKPTAIAFAIALELDREQTDELLRKAGFALSHSSKFDIIIDYFIARGKYDIHEINEALFAFDQSLLGA